MRPVEEKTLNGLLPVQFESAATAEMQKHCIDLEIAAKEVLNPQQKLTVDVADQPLFALSKILALLCTTIINRGIVYKRS